KEPKWYNDGVDYLRTSEEATGGWLSKHYESPKSVSTAFALLFLTRSTEKSFKKLEGRLRGGQGLPADLTQVNVDAEGRVIDSKEVPPLDVLLGQLDKEGVTELDTTLPIRLQLPADPQQRNAQLVRLRRMATRGPYEVRRMAVNTLARDRNLDNVPALIFALSDPDFRIVRAAQDGLRFISRKIDGNPLPEHPTKAEWQAAQAKWREWYLSLRPEGVGID
ncbi:MAG: HEAT repeat domain-containing protein, partial [Pirellulaceae bacterium]